MEQALVFKLGGGEFCLDSDEVQQILRIPPITRVPMVQEGVMGLCSIGGQIMAILDGRVLIHSPSTVDADEEKKKLLTFTIDGNAYGMVVDEVRHILPVDAQKIEPLNDENGLILGIIKDGNDLIQIVNHRKIVAGIKMPPAQIKEFKEQASVSSSLRGEVAVQKYLFFVMGREEFAVDIELIREIIFVPETITPIVDAEEAVLGMITLRDEVIRTLDLRRYFGLEPLSASSSNRILIAQVGASVVGLLVDAVLEVVEVAKDEVEALPESFGQESIAALIKRQGRIVNVLDTGVLERLVGETSSEPSGVRQEEREVSVAVEEHNTIEMRELVVFTIDKEEFAFDIEEVEEITRYTDITPLPESLPFVKGIINLRGLVIPIISLPERLGYPEKIDMNSKILVSRYRDRKVGFLVDNVSEILFVSPSQMTRNDAPDALFTDIINLEEQKRMILRLSIDKIFAQTPIESVGFAGG